jgi:FKBP-type peptidyl-prolyl cis-trans isomerase 2
MKIEKGRRVRLHCKLEVVGGEVLEESNIEYIHGSGKLLPGLEHILDGLQSGGSKEGVLPAKQAFGDESHLPTTTALRKEFPADAKLEAGVTFQARGANGQDVVLRIISVKDDKVEVKLLHPLADKDIKYKLLVLGVSDPSPPPLPGDVLEPDTE